MFNYNKTINVYNQVEVDAFQIDVGQNLQL
jgi:hypothetical protein